MILLPEIRCLRRIFSNFQKVAGLLSTLPITMPLSNRSFAGVYDLIAVISVFESARYPSQQFLLLLVQAKLISLLRPL